MSEHPDRNPLEAALRRAAGGVTLPPGVLSSVRFAPEAADVAYPIVTPEVTGFEYAQVLDYAAKGFATTNAGALQLVRNGATLDDALKIPAATNENAELNALRANAAAAIQLALLNHGLTPEVRTDLERTLANINAMSGAELTRLISEATNAASPENRLETPQAHAERMLQLAVEKEKEAAKEFNDAIDDDLRNGRISPAAAEAAKKKQKEAEDLQRENPEWYRDPKLRDQVQSLHQEAAGIIAPYQSTAPNSYEAATKLVAASANVEAASADVAATAKEKQEKVKAAEETIKAAEEQKNQNAAAKNLSAEDKAMLATLEDSSTYGKTLLPTNAPLKLAYDDVKATPEGAAPVFNAASPSAGNRNL